MRRGEGPKVVTCWVSRRDVGLLALRMSAVMAFPTVADRPLAPGGGPQRGRKQHLRRRRQLPFAHLVHLPASPLARTTVLPFIPRLHLRHQGVDPGFRIRGRGGPARRFTGDIQFRFGDINAHIGRAGVI